MSTIPHTLTVFLREVAAQSRRFRLVGLPTVFTMLPEPPRTSFHDGDDLHDEPLNIVP